MIQEMIFLHECSRYTDFSHVQIIRFGNLHWMRAGCMKSHLFQTRHIQYIYCVTMCASKYSHQLDFKTDRSTNCESCGMNELAQDCAFRHSRALRTHRSILCVCRSLTETTLWSSIRSLKLCRYSNIFDAFQTYPDIILSIDIKTILIF